MLALTFSQNVTGNVVMRANVSVLSTAGSSLRCNVRMCGTCLRICICLYVCVPQGTRICERLYHRHRTQTLNAPSQTLILSSHCTLQPFISMDPKCGHLLPRIHTRTVCATKPMAKMSTEFLTAEISNHVSMGFTFSLPLPGQSIIWRRH